MDDSAVYALHADRSLSFDMQKDADAQLIAAILRQLRLTECEIKFKLPVTYAQFTRHRPYRRFRFKASLVTRPLTH